MKKIWWKKNIVNVPYFCIGLSMLLLAINLKNTWKYESIFGSTKTKQNLTETDPGLRAVLSSHLLELWIHRVLELS